MIVAVHRSIPAQRIVVVSTTSMTGSSLGAAIAAWTRTGAVVELLTVLGCDPESAAPPGGWDRRGGFGTEGAWARARREEDRRACAVVGARPRWLPFGSADYERHGKDAKVRETVVRAVADAELILLPGYPLSHPDHAWVAELLSVSLGPRVALYAEQPYTRRAGPAAPVPNLVVDGCGDEAFERVRVRPRDRLAKWRAIRHYRSQLPLLGMRRSIRRGPHRYALDPEWVAWGSYLPPVA